MLLEKHSSYAIPKKRVVFICKITTGDLSSDLNIEKKIDQNSDLQLLQNEAAYSQYVKFERNERR